MDIIMEIAPNYLQVSEKICHVLCVFPVICFSHLTVALVCIVYLYSKGYLLHRSLQCSDIL